jgi:hypothetical protein
MMRYIVIGTLLAGAALYSAAGALASDSPRVVRVEPGPLSLTPDQQRDWECLQASTEDWGMSDAAAHGTDLTSSARFALRTYYLGRLNGELGDARFAEFMQLSRLQKAHSIDWTRDMARTCQNKMAHAAGFLKPMESKDFQMQGASPPPRS